MQTLIDLIKEFERRDRLALKYKTDYRTFSFTYLDLFKFINQCANFLRTEFKIREGDKIAIWGSNSPDWVIAYFAIIAVGGIVVPIDNKATGENAARIITNAGAKLAIKSKYRPELKSPRVWLENLKRCFEKYPVKTEFAARQSEDLVELVYTSGTTGDPKGVMITHHNLLSNIEAVIRHINVNERDQMLSVLPLSHLLEQTCDMLAELYIGASVIYLETLKPSLIFEALSEERITVFILVPRLLMGFKNAIREKFNTPVKRKILAFLSYLAGRLPFEKKKKIFFFIHKKFGRHFRFFVSGGANLDADTEDFWSTLGFKVVQGYGLTECSPILTANNEKERRAGSVGLPLDNVSLELSEDNEILARGPNIFKGYYHDEEKTKASFKDGWFLTGDIGWRDKDGYYFIKGRKKDVIVTAAGINIHPDDIEAILNMQPEIKESAVIGLATEKGEEVHAILILKDPGANAEAIVSRANDRLDSSQKISGFTIWPEKEFPKTTTLKIKKNLVKERISQSSRPANMQSGGDKLVEIIAEITGGSYGSIKDGSRLHSDLKLDSIGRVELVSRIEQEYNIDFPEENITELTAVDGLRAIISKTLKHGQAFKPAFWPFSKSIKKSRRVLMAVGLKILGIWCRVETAGAENLSKFTGPAIFAPNHISYFDQSSVLTALPKRIRLNIATAAWAEFFKPLGKNAAVRLFRRLNYYVCVFFFAVFPLSQIKNLKKNLQFVGKLADRGEHIMIFPEGERTKTAELLPLKKGVAALARQLKVPVIPVGISGTEKVLPRKAFWPRIGRVKVSFGEPIYVGDQTDQEFLKLLRQKIDDLRKE